MFFYENIMFLKEKKNFSVNELSKMISIPQTTLNDIFNKRTKNPKLETIAIIGIGLKKLKYINTLDDLIYKDLSKEN